ncbi:MAG: SDR family NAD(P)-dependent oxidoreductase [Luteolibacter sp.]
MSAATSYSCALVTGASAGLGEEFAIQLAPRVSKLVLVARREERLHHLADQLRDRYPHCAVAVIAADLSKHAEREALISALADTGFLPDLLVNNAGLGDYGEIVSAEWPRIEAMLRVNIDALTHLTHALVPHMIRRGHGAVMNVSSIAGLLPLPDAGVYAATKAYVSSFSEALRIELRKYRIPVVAVCPGPVKTEFNQVARRSPGDPGMPSPPWFRVPRDQVVAESLAALDGDRPRVFPGLKTALVAALMAGLPLLVLRPILAARLRL